MEIINLLLQGASILPAATIQPFLFLLQLAGAKRVVNDRNNHCFLHGDIAVSVPSSHNVIRYHRASPLHQHLILYSNNATQKHFNTSACRRNDGFDSAALPVVPPAAKQLHRFLTSSGDALPRNSNSLFCLTTTSLAMFCSSNKLWTSPGPAKARDHTPSASCIKSRSHPHKRVRRLLVRNTQSVQRFGKGSDSTNPSTTVSIYMK